MKLFLSVLLLSALEVQKSQAMKASRVRYNCVFSQHPLNRKQNAKVGIDGEDLAFSAEARICVKAQEDETCENRLKLLLIQQLKKKTFLM